MKRILLALIIVTLGSSLAYTQTGLSFQTLITNDKGSFGANVQRIVSNQPVKIMFSLKEGHPNGEVRYQEENEAETNQFGIVNVVIGHGQKRLGKDLQYLEWTKYDYFLEVQIDLMDGFGYQVASLEQLLIPPYVQQEDQVISLESGILTLSGSPESTIDLSKFIDEKIKDNSPQRLEAGELPGTLSLSSGNAVIINVEDGDPDASNENQTVSPGVGISIAQSGNDFEVTNTAPDQQVTLTDGGSGNVVIGGAYPDFTVDIPSTNNGAFSTTNNVTSNSLGDLVTDDFVFGSNSLDDLEGKEDDTRMFFNKSEAAFRVGVVDGEQWNRLNLGRGSFAAGINTIASGDASVAMGIDSRAEDDYTIAIGANSHASGQNSIAMGFAFADQHSIAIGTGVAATGNNSRALGYLSSATGSYSTSIGYSTEAIGHHSTSIGFNTVSNGNASLALGYETNTFSFGESILGLYNTSYSPIGGTENIEATDRLLVVGNGTTDSNRSDALVMLKNGNTTLHGNLTIDADNIGGDPGYTLPAQAGTANQVLTTTGGGTTSWQSPTGDSPFNLNAGIISNKNPYTEDFVFGSPSLEDDGNFNHDRRMFFDKSKAAFRVGRVTNDRWNNSNVGSYSTGIGYNVIASGNYSFSMGYNSQASASYARAIGSQAIATGVNSTALGTLTRSEGTSSISMGYDSEATADNAIALGNEALANGIHAFAIGNNNLASGVSSVSMGAYADATGDYSIAMGPYGEASGERSIAFFGAASGNHSISFHGNATGQESLGLFTGNSQGFRSFAFGGQASGDHSISFHATASGNSSVAINGNSVASGSYALAVGAFSEAIGDHSRALGYRTQAPSYGETVLGYFNTIYSPVGSNADRLFVIGNGLGNINRSNTLTMLKNGNTTVNGNWIFNGAAIADSIAIAGEYTLPMTDGADRQVIITDGNGEATWGSVDVSTTNELQDLTLSGSTLYISNDPDGSDVDLSGLVGPFEEVGDTVIRAINTDASFIVGSASLDDLPGDEDNSRMLFDKSTGAFRAGTGYNNSWDQPNRGNNSVAFGLGSAASGNASFAQGHRSVASGQYSFASGVQSTSSGDYSIAMGNVANALSNSTLAIGSGAIAGNGLATSGDRAIAIGSNARAPDLASLAIGYNARATYNSAIAIGINSRSNNLGAISIGANAFADGGNSFAAGNHTEALGYGSVALGRYTNANSSYSFAGGYSSNATGTGSVALGYRTETNGDYAFASGYYSDALGSGSVSMGSLNIASGDMSVALGRRSRARSYGETSIGLFNTDYAPLSEVAFDPSDRLFTIGNGTAPDLMDRSDALVMLKNGNTTLNGQLTIDGDNLTGAGEPYTLPAQDGDENQVMVTDGAGEVSWEDPSQSPFVLDELSNVIHNGNPNDENFVFGSTQVDDVIGTDDDTRMFFNKSNGAFRVGGVTDSRWNDTNVGYYSFASGLNTQALGLYSIAIGYNANSSANSSFAAGSNTTASGIGSVAFGQNSISSGNVALSAGYFASASGDLSVAMGSRITAWSESETVIGIFSTDYVPISQNSFAPTDRLFVIGNGTGDDLADRSDALVMLKNGNTAANGDWNIDGDLVANSLGVNGQFDLPTTDGANGQALITDGFGNIGWGVPPAASAVFTNLSNVISPTLGDLANDDFVIGSWQLDDDQATSDDDARMFFDKSKGAFRAGILLAGNLDYWNDENIGNYSVAMGEGVRAAGNHSIAIGSGVADGNQSVSLGSAFAQDHFAVAIGSGAIASNDYSLAIGDVISSGNRSIAIGNGVNASGNYSTSIGNTSVALGDRSSAFGSFLSARSYGETALGIRNTTYVENSTGSFDPADRLLVVGNGPGVGNTSDALVILKNGDTEINGNLTIDPANDDTGYTLPNSDGTNGQVMTTNGSGNVSWAPVGAGFTHRLGEVHPDGGIIFYLYIGTDGDEHGLAVHTDEATGLAWSTSEDMIGADRSWDGTYNTSLMGAATSPAKAYIESLGADWYIPSIDELELLFTARFHINRALNAGGYTLVTALTASDNDGYWSSTEHSLYNRVLTYRGTIWSGEKPYPLRIRAIRSF